MQLSDQRLQAADCGREKAHFQLIDAVIEYLQLLTSIIEIFFKRCANGCDAPLSSNRDVALREAAELLIQTLPLEARTSANGWLLSNRNGAEFIRRCIWFQRPPKSVKENAFRGPGSVQPELRLAINDAVTVKSFLAAHEYCVAARDTLPRRSTALPNEDAGDDGVGIVLVQPRLMAKPSR
jgi:hypothetical protein